mmetsp:Transcript_115411/g.372924  ORF Transcript_115411/g.372924 Transcript_115411/m.372924 type:complete len:225 (+) Transcript_115411:1206-1880(+)
MRGRGATRRRSAGRRTRSGERKRRTRGSGSWTSSVGARRSALGVRRRNLPRVPARPRRRLTMSGSSNSSSPSLTAARARVRRARRRPSKASRPSPRRRSSRGIGGRSKRRMDRPRWAATAMPLRGSAWASSCPICRPRGSPCLTPAQAGSTIGTRATTRSLGPSHKCREAPTPEARSSTCSRSSRPTAGPRRRRVQALQVVRGPPRSLATCPGPAARVCRATRA